MDKKKDEQEDEDEEEEHEEDIIEEEYELGLYVRDELIPYAVEYFLGIVDEDEGEGEVTLINIGL